MGKSQLYTDFLNMAISYHISFAVLELTDKLLTDFFFFFFNLCCLFDIHALNGVVQDGFERYSRIPDFEINFG